MFPVRYELNLIYNLEGGGVNTSTVALRDVGGDEKGTLCLGVQPGHSVPGGYKYWDRALQVGRVSNLRE
jgi:hypothetical protein